MLNLRKIHPMHAMFLQLLTFSAFCPSWAQILGPPEAAYVVLAGDSLVLSCYAPEIGNLTFQWVEYITDVFGNVLFQDSRSNDHMKTKDTKYDVTGWYNLHINEVTMEDAGYYGCLLLGTHDRYYAKVAVIEPLSLNITGQRENQTTAITCSTRYGYYGDFDLRIELSLRIFQTRAGVVRMTFEDLASEDKIDMSSGLTRAQIYTSHNFTTSTNDNGNYVICDVHAALGEENSTFVSATKSTNLKILCQSPETIPKERERRSGSSRESPDNVSMFPLRDAYHVGDDVTCSATGSPRLVFQWLQLLPSNHGKRVGRRLRMTRGMVGYNKWTCSVVSPYGWASAPFVFDVLMVTEATSAGTTGYMGTTEVETSPEAISIDVGVAFSGRYASITAGLLIVFTLHG